MRDFSRIHNAQIPKLQLQVCNIFSNSTLITILLSFFLVFLTALLYYYLTCLSNPNFFHIHCFLLQFNHLATGLLKGEKKLAECFRKQFSYCSWVLNMSLSEYVWWPKGLWKTCMHHSAFTVGNCKYNDQKICKVIPKALTYIW